MSIEKLAYAYGVRPAEGNMIFATPARVYSVFLESFIALFPN